MINKLIKIYNSLEYKIETNNYKIHKLLFYKVIKKLCVYFFFLLLYIKDAISKSKPIKFNDNHLIISFTSFPARISKVWLTIRSIEYQTIKPSKIILYLSKEEFLDGFNSLPRKLKRYANKGVEIIFVDDNLRSHKKYFYSFQDYPDYKIITIDDDLYYPPDTIERLLDIERRFPTYVCANVASKIETDGKNTATYLQWKKVKENYTSSKFYIAIGHGAVLYPESFRPDELFNIVNIKNLAFHADDLWLKANELICGIDVAVGEYFPHPMVIPFTQKIALRKINTSGKILNDMQWNALSKHFNLNKMLRQ